MLLYKRDKKVKISERGNSDDIIALKVHHMEMRCAITSKR